MRSSLYGVVLAVIWSPCWGAETVPPIVDVRLLGAGVVKIEGHDYSDVATLKKKIAQIQHRNPKPLLHIDLGDEIGPDSDLGPAMALVRKAGLVKGYWPEVVIDPSN